MSGVKVSVIVPFFNGHNTIMATVKSILNQTYNNYEIIIVDDKSTLGDLSVFKFPPDVVKIITLDVNCGPSKARNIGVEFSKGEIVCFLDADDLWPRFYLERVVDSFSKKNDFDILVSKGFVFGYGEVIRPLNNALGKFKSDLIWSNQIGCPSGVSVRKRVFKKYSFDNDLRLFEDYLFYVHIANDFRFCFIDNYFFYRVEGQNHSSFYKYQFQSQQKELLLDKLRYSSLRGSYQRMVQSVVNSLEYKSISRKVISQLVLAFFSWSLFKKYYNYVLVYLKFLFKKRHLNGELLAILGEA